MEIGRTVKKDLALLIALALAVACDEAPSSHVSGIDVEKLAPVEELAASVDCAALAAACRCAERMDPKGGVNALGDGRGARTPDSVTAGGLDGAIAACERSIAGRLRDYSRDERWARLFVAGTGSPRTACMMNQAADAGFPGGRQGLWDALGLDPGHWRRAQDVCWRR